MFIVVLGNVVMVFVNVIQVIPDQDVTYHVSLSIENKKK